MSRSSSLRKALHHCLDQRLTFAAFRVPGQPVQIWAQRSPELEHVDGTLLLELNQVFVLAPFDLDVERVPFIRADVELAFVEIDPDTDLLNTCQGSLPDHTPLPAVTERSAYLNGVNAAKAAFRPDGLRKVVLSRVAPAPLPANELPDRFIERLEELPNAFVAMAFTPEHGLWIGASPERLVHAEEGHVIVDALAGTMPADNVPEQAGAWGAKELEEQEMVAQHVMRTFIGAGLVNIVSKGPQVLVAGPVAHLHTSVEGDLGERLLSELVLALHPTPAVGGAPTSEARHFIREHEGHDRQLYSGFWGPWSADGITDLYVNLRCLRVSGDEAKAFVGAGITAGSEAEREWDETERKAAVWVRPVMATAQG